MVKIENDCVGCPQGCINCGRKYVEHYYCDECGDEAKLYEVEGMQLCRDCVVDYLASTIEQNYNIVEGSECYL